MRSAQAIKSKKMALFGIAGIFPATTNHAKEKIKVSAVRLNTNKMVLVWALNLLIKIAKRIKIENAEIFKK